MRTPIPMTGFLAKAKILRRIPAVAVSVRRWSAKAKMQIQMTEVDTAEYDLALNHLGDLIHRIHVKNATPEWLPFVPGSSFWVPPPPSPSTVVHLVHNLSYHDHRHQHDHHHSPLLSTPGGWPSSNFFIHDNESTDGEDTDMEGTAKVKVLTFSESVAHSEDEEG